MLILCNTYKQIHFGLYIPKKLSNNIFNSSAFPRKKLIFVGTFPFFGYALVTGISQALYPS